MNRQQVGITFAVDDVTPASATALETDATSQLAGLLGTDVIASGVSGDVIEHACDHPLLAAIYKAFNEHRPLVLSPDHIWLTITRGIADHMRIHGEALRSRFVKHLGRLTLTTRSATTIKQTDWPAAFADWCTQIAGHVGADVHETLISDFSTTTDLERIASHVVMMDIFENYFKYEMVGICGIPTVTLRGTVEDWKRLRTKAAKLEVFEVGWWLEHLMPILDQFVSAAEGEPDIAFWKRICKLREEYGGHIINGWVTTFFAYLREGPTGPADTQNWTLGTSKGIQIWNAPSAMSFVPITWRDALSGRRTFLRAVGGLFGVRQDAITLALEPLAGWAVAREAEETAMAIAAKEFAAPCPISFDNTPDERERLPDDMIRFYNEMQSCRFPEFEEGRFVELHGWQSIRRAEPEKSAKRFEELGLYVIGMVHYSGPNLIIALADSFFRERKSLCAHPVFIDDTEKQNSWKMVAESFSELVVRLAETKGVPWWTEPGWVPARKLLDFY